VELQSLTASVLFVDSETGRQYTVRLVKEDALADDASHRYIVGPVGWRDGRPPFAFSDVEGDPHGEARHVGNLFNLRREEFEGETWVVADLDWDSDELALEAKRLVDENRITGVSIHPSDGDAFLLCGEPPKGASIQQVQALAEEFDPEGCESENWIEAWANLIIGSATLLMLPAFEDAEVITAGGRGEATDEEPWDAGEAMRKAGAADDPAAAFRAIAIETTTGEPSERQHWALPHHRTAGSPANAAAIRNARARFGQTKNLKDQGAARAHLFEVHKLPSEVEEAATVGKIMTELIEKAVPIASEGLETVQFANNTFENSTMDFAGKPWMISAAADIHRPPADWFTDPQLDGPTPLTIEDNGRVFGHLALWSTCHRGFDSQCVTPPQDATEYEEFHDNARVMVDSGELIGVGCLTFDVSHADARASADVAKRHYDHSGTVAAFVRAGQDEHGVWVAGAERPGLTKDQRELMRRLSLSGDWRPKGGSYFLIAAQAVPVPGFPIRARVASNEVVELTTRGPANEMPDPLEIATDEALVASAVQHLVNEIRGLRAELEYDRKLRDYEKALVSFSG
jgi:hypothetical protein